MIQAIYQALQSSEFMGSCFWNNTSEISTQDVIRLRLLPEEEEKHYSKAPALKLVICLTMAISQTALQSRPSTMATMNIIGHCGRCIPTVQCLTNIPLVSRVVQPKRRFATRATSSSETVAPSVPQQVNSALQRRQAKLADLAGRLQTAEASQDVVREVFQEFQGLNEQVQQLAQHMEAIDSKAQAKAAEKALKKERKSAEKALKKERKAAEKAVKALAKEKEPMASTGFTVDSDSEFSAELNHAVVGTVGGDTVVTGTEFGSDQPQYGGQFATATPRSSTATAPAAVISVCQGSSCQEQGSEKLLDYVKKTAGAELDVVPCKCLGKCEQAPNLRVRLPQQKPVLRTSLQNGKEVKTILQDTKAWYGSEMMKSMAVTN